MEYAFLNNVLIQTFDIPQCPIETYSFEVIDLPFLKIRDVLMVLGKIYLEDTEDQIYVATIKSGFFKKNNAYLALQLKENCLNISISAKEGLINQHTTEGALNEFKSKISKYLK